MACGSLVGVRNLMLTFFNCETGVKIGPISHKLSSADLPTIRLCEYKNTSLTGGFTKREQTSLMIEAKVIRDLRVPTGFYQGCASISIQIEYENGIVITALNGNTTDDSKSDMHEVTLMLDFEVIDELLPTGALAA